MTDLKRCPFCGGEASEDESLNGNYYVIICSRCLVQTDDCRTKDEAIDDWNSRVSDNPYGFFKREYETGPVDVLMTGDGRTQFTDIVNTDGTMSLGIGYGDITKAINEKVKHPEGSLITDIACKWEIRFNNPASVDALIETLQRVKAGLTV